MLYSELNLFYSHICYFFCISAELVSINRLSTEKASFLEVYKDVINSIIKTLHKLR